MLRVKDVLVVPFVYNESQTKIKTILDNKYYDLNGKSAGSVLSSVYGRADKYNIIVILGNKNSITYDKKEIMELAKIEKEKVIAGIRQSIKEERAYKKSLDDHGI